MKKILILGSTGSIGINTLNVIRKFSHLFKVEAITTNKNVETLSNQIKEFKPKFAVVTDEEAANKIDIKIFSNTKVLTGSEGLIEVAKNAEYDILVSSLVGFAGLAPTLEAIKRGKRIALANKETLVVAGKLVMDLCKKYNSEIIPVDSEHSAIFQSLVGEDFKNIKKIILTASGGPFLHKDISELENVTVEDALNHPNWSMGNKITIDSATMMNKGLEVIEAKWLFNLGNDKIEVVIHPQSIIHSMVEFVDGSIKAQLSVPDMKLPIQYALSYPDRFNSNFVETNFVKIGKLTFFEPNLEKFRCLKLAYDVLEQGGISACILNAANEIAVNRYLNKRIKFTDIPVYIEKALNKFPNIQNYDLGTVFEADFKTRMFLFEEFN